MRTKVTLALLFLNVALFFFIFKFEQPWQIEQQSLQQRSNVLGPETANIQSIEIAGADAGSAVSLVLRPDGWYLTKPFEWPANKNAVNRITNDLQQLRREASFSVRDLPKNNQSLANYGLDPPALTATYTSADPSLPRNREAAGGRKYTVALGSKTQDGSSFYLLSPDREFVHVVGRAIAESLAQTAADLRLATLFTIADFEARSLAIQAPSPMAAIRLRREADDRWLFESPITARADRTQTRRLIGELGALRASDFLPDVPAEATTSPATRITLEGNGRNETLLLYPTASVAAAGRDTEYVGRMDSRNTYFKVTVPAQLRTRLDTAQTALRESRVLDFDARNVTKVTIHSGAGDIELQRLDPAGPTDAASWRALRPDPNGASQPINADSNAVNRLLDQLTRLTAERFASDAPTPRERETWGFNSPERSVMLAVSAPPGATGSSQPVSIRFDIGVDVRTNTAYINVPPSESIYEVKPEILGEIPVAADAYRDRLLRALAPNTQINGLRLTDLQENKVIADLPAGGTPNPAIAALLAQLRTLRARSFVTGVFSESENAAENKPWRYQLDVITAPSAGTQPETMSLFLGERTGGNTQYAGSRTFNLVWLAEQPLVDALWQVTYGGRDPGPTLPAGAPRAQ